LISAKSDYCGGCRVRLLPSIRYGTEGYPETIARRLRALNITTWIAALLGAGFAITQLLNPAPGMWKPGIVNALAALIFATIPLLHRFGPLAAPLAFSVAGYAAIFLDCFFLGIGTGMQFYYLVNTALVILFLGSEHAILSAALGGVAAILIIALETFVSRDTGLQPPVLIFGNFIITTIASCVVLFTIVLYGVREAEREHARSESLLANILPVPPSPAGSKGAARLLSRIDTKRLQFYLQTCRGLLRGPAIPLPTTWCSSSIASSPSSIG
jgi:adenylate cyclase